MKRKWIAVFGGIALSLVLTFGSESPAMAQGTSEETQETEIPSTSVHFFAVGDALISETLNKGALQMGGGKTYDYHYIYSAMEDTIASYDLAAINQETILIDNYAQHSGYPAFGTPNTEGDAIADAGFDIVTQATNHSYDKGMAGINQDITFWRTKHPEITMLGLHSSREDASDIDYIESNGITFALFNYAYGLNGMRLPAGKDYAVDLLSDTDKLLADVRTAEKTADFTIVFCHMGDEYSYKPNASQKTLALQLAEAGADLIVGAHPHCIEPCEVVKAENGNIALVYYSLGNFVSSQLNATTQLEGAANVTITKVGDLTAITDYDFIPLVNDWQGSTPHPVFLKDYTEEEAAKHHFARTGKKFTAAGLWSTWHQVTGR